MKTVFSKVLVALAVLVTTAQVHAYQYTFTNHTEQEIGIALRYHGINEPRYHMYCKPNTMIEYYPGEDGMVPWRKIGFVPETFWYLLNPTAAQKTNPNSAPWREFQITFVPGSYYTKALELAENAAKTFESGAKLGLEAGAAYATGGATTVAAGATDAAKKAAAALAAQQQATGKVLGATASGVSSLGLASLIKSVGKLAGESMLRNRHIDIVHDETGKLIFMSLQ